MYFQYFNADSYTWFSSGDTIIFVYKRKPNPNPNRKSINQYNIVNCEAYDDRLDRNVFFFFSFFLVFSFCEQNTIQIRFVAERKSLRKQNVTSMYRMRMWSFSFKMRRKHLVLGLFESLNVYLVFILNIWSYFAEKELKRRRKRKIGYILVFVYHFDFAYQLVLFSIFFFKLWIQ